MAKHDEPEGASAPSEDSTVDETSDLAKQAEIATDPDGTVWTTDPAVIAAFEAKVADSIRFLESVGFSVTHRSIATSARTSRPQAAIRDTSEKAEPSMVEAYFDGTGLTRKQIADAVGVGMSVISTVTKESGDRWSLVRFLRAKELIEAERARIAALLLAPAAEAVAETTEPATEPTEPEKAAA